ncbi:IS6 family transposase [Rhodococcus qingshengii]|uniref:IS6 family transposase n=1 Tax=Rhodococcus qingshengii TaxID=334542 RepID=UPI003657823C
MTTPTLSYKGHRYPVEIINHCVWLYFRFPLSFREVEELMLERGVVVSYETIRRWCTKFGQTYANQLRRRRPQPGDKWHLDEVFIRINGTLHYLWRAVDQDGNVLDVLVQSRRNALAAKKFFRRLLKVLEYVPRVIVTDKLTSYSVAHREVLASVVHHRSKYLNIRAENSHQPTRQRERAMKRFTSPVLAQRFLSAFSGTVKLLKMTDLGWSAGVVDVQGLRVPTGDHLSLRMALLPVHAFVSRDRVTHG